MLLNRRKPMEIMSLIRGIQIDGCYCWSCGQTKLQRFFPKNATKTCHINTSMIAWFVRFWVFTMYCTKNNTKEAFFGVSTTNLWPDVTYQSTTTGLFRNKGWIHHRDQSRHAIVERRHEGLNRLDHLTSTQPRFSPPQNRHGLKEVSKKTTSNAFLIFFGLVYFHPSSSQTKFLSTKNMDSWNLTSWWRSGVPKKSLEDFSEPQTASMHFAEVSQFAMLNWEESTTTPWEFVFFLLEGFFKLFGFAMDLLKSTFIAVENGRRDLFNGCFFVVLLAKRWGVVGFEGGLFVFFRDGVFFGLAFFMCVNWEKWTMMNHEWDWIYDFWCIILKRRKTDLRVTAQLQIWPPQERIGFQERQRKTEHQNVR